MCPNVHFLCHIHVYTLIMSYITHPKHSPNKIKMFCFDMNIIYINLYVCTCINASK